MEIIIGVITFILGLLVFLATMRLFQISDDIRAIRQELLWVPTGAAPIALQLLSTISQNVYAIRKESSQLPVSTITAAPPQVTR